ncbi:hypothetical protein ACIRD3_38730 [Kitasatospora sp. NPDC093550]|uniref:hypothetical protein n=1 Tax=Kitasatospora sp. NPDC093550 TaxID=3364089 RepID=UPI003824BC69
MSEPDPFEEDLLYALTRTGEGFRTGPADLVDGGYRRGRRRWRRRSTAAVVGGAAALALVGAGAVHLAGASSVPGAVAAAASASGTGPAAPSASPSTVVITGDEVVATLRALLPAGATTGAKGRGTDDPAFDGTFAGASLVFDDGQGPAAVSLSVQRNRKGRAQERSCPDPKLDRIDSCAVSTLADGSRLFLSQGYEYPDHRAETKEWIVALDGPDGREVVLSEWNAAQEKGAAVSRPAPPLSPERLRAIVTDRSWDRIVAGLKDNGVDRAAEGTGLSLDDRRALLARLLPAGTDVTGIDGNEVTADVRLDRSGTAGSVFLQLRKVSPAAAEKTAQAFEGATVLPDGGRLRLHGPGTADPQGRPMAELLRGDRYVSAAQGPTGQPLLSVAQLEAIVAAPEWRGGR